MKGIIGPKGTASLRLGARNAHIAAFVALTCVSVGCAHNDNQAIDNQMQLMKQREKDIGERIKRVQEQLHETEMRCMPRQPSINDIKL